MGKTDFNPILEPDDIYIKPDEEFELNGNPWEDGDRYPLKGPLVLRPVGKHVHNAKPVSVLDPNGKPIETLDGLVLYYHQHERR